MPANNCRACRERVDGVDSIKIGRGTWFDGANGRSGESHAQLWAWCRLPRLHSIHAGWRTGLAALPGLCNFNLNACDPCRGQA